MAYEVMAYAMTSEQMGKMSIIDRDHCRMGTFPKGFARDIPIEHHTLQLEKTDVWLQRLTPEIICKRIEKMVVALEGIASCLATMRCPHGGQTIGNGLSYLGVQLVFCFDCQMLMQGEYVLTGGDFCYLSSKVAARYHRMKSEYDHWVFNRKITWIWIGKTRAPLGAYKRQMGF